MKHIKTVAFEITEETYSFAVAVLPPIFATIPIDNVIGHWVILNELAVTYTRDARGRQHLYLENSWMDAEDFGSTYDSTEINAIQLLSFQEVEKII